MILVGPSFEDDKKQFFARVWTYFAEWKVCHMGAVLDPKCWEGPDLCGNWRPVFDERVLERPHNRSAYFEAREGKSSPKSIFLALGKGRSPKLILALLIAAKTFFRLNTDN